MSAEVSTDPAEAEEIRLRYLDVYTSNVADVLDELGLPSQGLDPAFAPYPADAGKLCGWAATIRGQHVHYEPAGGDPAKMRACEHLPPGSVSVWGGPGEGVCFFGELIALRMRERGCVGALVDGGVRDIVWLGRHGFPVFARYRTPVQSIGRWMVNAYDVPIDLPGATSRHVRVESGDFVLGDEDGVIIVPSAVVVPVLEQAEELGGREDAIREELNGGLSLDEALAKFGHV